MTDAPEAIVAETELDLEATEEVRADAEALEEEGFEAEGYEEEALEDEGDVVESDVDESVLALGAWEPHVHQALTDLIRKHGVESEGYDPRRPPLAIIDCDDTLIHNDLGEAMLRFMVTRRRLRTDRGFWHVLPDKMGRDAITAAYKAVAGRSDAEVMDTAAYRRYRAGLIGVYENLRESNIEEAYLFAARILKGLHERTVAELVEEVIDYELSRPLGTEDIEDGPPFSGMGVPSGIRVYLEMLDLLRALEAYGFQTWIVSASNQYVVRALARRLNFPEERVLGIELQMQGGSMTDRPVEPWPVGEGKLEAFLDTVGRSPLLVIGDSMGDFELLENCEELSIVIDKGDENLSEKAEDLGWLMQREPLSV
jgi:phosphoserine phosphatase